MFKSNSHKSEMSFTHGNTHLIFLSTTHFIILRANISRRPTKAPPYTIASPTKTLKHIAYAETSKPNENCTDQTKA